MAIISELRLVRANGHRRPDSAPAGKLATHVATIMVVEDDPIAGRTLAEALEFAGYQVRIAVSGKAACALQRRMQPDLIIVDLMLPDMDGFILTTSLKSMTEAPIVICSARDGEVDRVLALKLGAADFVAKPFDLDDLEARIEAVISGNRNNPESGAM